MRFTTETASENGRKGGLVTGKRNPRPPRFFETIVARRNVFSLWLRLPDDKLLPLYEYRDLAVALHHMARDPGNRVLKHRLYGVGKVVIYGRGKATVEWPGKAPLIMFYLPGACRLCGRKRNRAPGVKKRVCATCHEANPVF